MPVSRRFRILILQSDDAKSRWIIGHRAPDNCHRGATASLRVDFTSSIWHVEQTIKFRLVYVILLMIGRLNSGSFWVGNVEIITGHMADASVM